MINSLIEPLNAESVPANARFTYVGIFLLIFAKLFLNVHEIIVNLDLNTDLAALEADIASFNLNTDLASSQKDPRTLIELSDKTMYFSQVTRTMLVANSDYFKYANIDYINSIILYQKNVDLYNIMHECYYDLVSIRNILDFNDTISVEDRINIGHAIQHIRVTIRILLTNMRELEYIISIGNPSYPFLGHQWFEFP